MRTKNFCLMILLMIVARPLQGITLSNGLLYGKFALEFCGEWFADFCRERDWAALSVRTDSCVDVLADVFKGAARGTRTVSNDQLGEFAKGLVVAASALTILYVANKYNNRDCATLADVETDVDCLVLEQRVE